MGEHSLPMSLMTCPTCGREVSVSAANCPGCGHPFREAAPAVHVVSAPQRKWSGGVAAVLSFFFPGVGQMYKGQVLNGIVWMGAVFLGYVFWLFPGLILHVFCVIGAAMGDPYK